MIDHVGENNQTIVNIFQQPPNIQLVDEDNNSKLYIKNIEY